ncbi:MAG TPA: metal-dependent transcriptional regulator, partial [Bacteroidales bacterium]|nr:metal-dependent transcriptional regulator [Bacteroidales bacterium]
MGTNVSVSAEDFLKAIYRFEMDEGIETRPGLIAGKLGITNAAATDMARKLALKKLIDYEKYKKYKLTPSGKRIALGTIRKHRLWETFLNQVLGLSMHEVHREAELLEHSTSDILAEKISLFLGNPQTDPHGDPIPDEKGNIYTDREIIRLSLTNAGDWYMIKRLLGYDEEYFDFCKANNLIIGSTVYVREQYSKPRMTDIEVKGTRIVLNSAIS